MGDDLIKRLRLHSAGIPVRTVFDEAADHIEQLERERDGLVSILAQAGAGLRLLQRAEEAEAKLAKGVEALPKLHAVLDILLNNFPTKARPKWVADTERHIDEAIAALAELERKE